MTGKVIRNGAAVLVLALLAGGCGSKAPAPATCALPTDGTRLKALHLQAEDGAREDVSRFGEWYDSTLATYCRFQPAADGVARCLPTVAFHWLGRFADAACTQRVASARRCLGVPQHVTVELAPVCAGLDMIPPLAVYALGPGSVPAVTYSDVSGTCTATPNDEEQATFYPLLSEIPATAFVAATFERVTGARIQGSELAAEDGTRGRTSQRAFDTALGTACEPEVAADGEVRCVPSDAFATRAGAYADAACTQGMVPFAPWECDPAFRRAYTGVEERELCTVLEGSGPVFRYPSKIHVHEVAAPSTPANIFQESYSANGTSTCEGVPNVYGQQFTLAGAEIPAAELARARDQEVACGAVGVSGSRLKAHNLVFDDGTLFSRPYHASWVDAQTGQDCSFKVAADDVLRCLPDGQFFAAARFFADASCTQGLIPVSRCDAFPRGAPKFAIANEMVGGACAPGGGYIDVRSRVYTLGGGVTPGALYEYDFNQTPAVCAPFAGGSAAVLAELLQAYELRPLGAEVPPTTFVAGAIEGL